MSKDGMDIFKGRRAVAFAGMGVALLAGLVIAVFMLMRDGGSTEAPPASQGGLVVQTGRDDDIKLDARRPLRCFVNGQLIGELTVSDCARRNGVATGALDVGLDRSGALAGTNGATSDITPLPPDAASADAPIEEYAGVGNVTVTAAAARVAACWRYGEAQWTRLPDDQTLPGCVQALYSGQCDKVGPPAYGRWGDRTLRLVGGRIEVSPDNRNFHGFAASAPGCPAAPRL
jgi:hypothetical protein